MREHELIDKWIPTHNKETLSKILHELGISNIEELFRDIPDNARISEEEWNRLEIGLKRPLSEREVTLLLEDKISRVRLPKIPPFIGGGIWLHYRPAYIDYIITMGEFLTSYTPYQAEASQGLLQALFEYQSLIAELLDMDVVSSSHYDWSTSLAEAVLMSLRINRKRMKILVPDTMNPRHLKVLKSYLSPHDVKIEQIKTENGEVIIDNLQQLVDSDTAAVYVELPSYLGVIDRNLKDLEEIVHKHKSLLIVGTDPLATAIYKSPGEIGADIAVGDAQSLGLGLNYGGPYLGIIAVRDDMKLIRQLPGRIVGLTKDKNGERAFTLILQTREQHIRRAKATSNITTNEALMSIAAAAFIAGHGREGLVKLAHMIRGRTIYTRRRLENYGFKTIGNEVFRDITVCFPFNFTQLAEYLKTKHDILIGPSLTDVAADYIGENCGIISVSDMHTKEHLDQLVSHIAEYWR